MTRPAAGTRWLTLGLLAVGLLSGCAGSDGFAILDTERTEDDVLPPSVTDVLELNDFEVESARLSASSGGVDYFVIAAGSPETGSPCLLIAGPTPVVGCGGGGGEVTVSSQSGDEAQLVRAPAEDGYGWTAISENIRIRTPD